MLWLVQKARKPTRALKLPALIHCRILGDSGNLREFGAPYRHGTFLAPKQGAYQKQAKG